MNRLAAAQALKGWVQGVTTGIILILLTNKVVLDQVVVLTLAQWTATLAAVLPRALLFAAVPVTLACLLVATVPALSATQGRRVLAAFGFAAVAAAAVLLASPPREVVSVVHLGGAAPQIEPQTRSWPAFGPAYLPAIDAAIAGLFGMLLAVADPKRRP